MPTFLKTKVNYKWFAPTNIIFGRGTINSLGESLPFGDNALIVTSNGSSTKQNGSLDKVIQQLNNIDVKYTVFNEIMANPTKDIVMKGAEVARQNKCNIVIAIGGGSVMDAAKAISAMATNKGDLWDYVEFGTGKGKILNNIPLPLVCITTTSGTGSESDAGAVITNTETNEKTAFFGMFPVLAICDPDLTIGISPKLTAYQGFDALFHSTETFISKNANLASDMVAKEAIKNIGAFLPKAIQDGANVEARERVAFASSMSSFSMTLGGCTSEHSLEHAMSAYYPALPHGAGLIMISVAYYTNFIKKGYRPDRFVKMAKLLGNKEAKEPMDFIVQLKKIQQECGVDDLKMSDYGINSDDFVKMAKNAMSCMGMLFENDPITLTNEDCIAIYRQSFK